MYAEAANMLLKEQTTPSMAAEPDEVDANTLLIKLHKMVLACELYIFHCRKLLELALGGSGSGGSASKGADASDASSEIQRMIKQPLGKMKKALDLAETTSIALIHEDSMPEVPPLDMRDIQLRLKMTRAEYNEVSVPPA